MMSELGEGVGALRRAAGHLAQGTAERLSPTYDRARNMAGRGWESTRGRLSPVSGQVKQRAEHVRAMRNRKMEAPKHSRMRTMRRLVLAGAAVGAAGAAMARRRRQEEWQEYDKMTGFDQSRYAESEYGAKASARQKVATGAANMADSLSSGAGRIADSLHERSAQMREKGESDKAESGQQGAHAAAPMPERQGMPPRSTGPGPVGTPGVTALGPGTPAGPRERLGDPALDFPDER
jgi:hypothetical protein